MADNSTTKAEEKKVAKRPFRLLRIFINIILLLTTVIVIIQNAHSIKIDFLWMQIDISLALLIFITGSIGSVITLFVLLLKK